MLIVPGKDSSGTRDDTAVTVRVCRTHLDKQKVLVVLGCDCRQGIAAGTDSLHLETQYLEEEQKRVAQFKASKRRRLILEAILEVFLTWCFTLALSRLVSSTQVFDT